MDVFWTIIGYGCAMVLLIYVAGLCLNLLAETITALPLFLFGTWILFCLGVPFYAVHYFDSWWWFALIVPLVFAAYAPFVYFERLP